MEWSSRPRAAVLLVSACLGAAAGAAPAAPDGTAVLGQRFALAIEHDVVSVDPVAEGDERRRPTAAPAVTPPPPVADVVAAPAAVEPLPVLAGVTGPAWSGASPLGVPAPVLAAYHRAEAALARSHPACGLSWSLLAGIGKVESGHAAGGRVDARGRTRGHILGPRLDGTTPGTRVIADTDRGRWDGDPEFDRAVGPMQFLPGTWVAFGRDGSGDGVADPHNVLDAALAAGRYLCASGADLATPDGRQRAVLRYNGSADYVRTVLGWADQYAVGAVATTPLTGSVPTAPVTPALEPPPPAAPGPAPAAAPVGATTPTQAAATAPPPPSPTPTPDPQPTPEPTPDPTPEPEPSPEPEPTTEPTPEPSPSEPPLAEPPLADPPAADGGVSGP